jgi:hypothetical protein
MPVSLKSGAGLSKSAEAARASIGSKAQAATKNNFVTWFIFYNSFGEIHSPTKFLN